MEIKVTMKNIYSYEAPAFGYGYETRYIYNMVGEDGKTYVWKTSTFMCEKVLDEENGWEIDAKGRKWAYNQINKGDVIIIKASVKGESEYKGEPQTELTRVKVVSREFKAKTWEEIQAEKKAAKEAKKEEQLASLKGEDFIWTMPYRQFKEHYSDCETVEGSFERRRSGDCVISVIIREGRLKASGVRGEHYSGYEFINENGQTVCYRAVNDENALKRAKKDFPECTWELNRIYDYRDYHRIF